MRSIFLAALLAAGCNDSLSDSNDLAMALDGGFDGALDADNGSPSKIYPAPHPPMPQLVNAKGGRILTSPKIYLVFFPNDTREADLQTFTMKLGASSYWTTTTSEYGVGALSYAGTIELTESAPKNIGSDEIQTWVAQKLQSGAFGSPDPQAIYTLFYPSTTTITQPNPVSTFLPGAQSCSAFSGYHDDTTVAVDGGTGVGYAYAVIPTCSSSIDSITEVLSHEWVEASTDPEVTSTGAFTLTGGPNTAYYLPDQDHLIWAVLGGGEAGDLCEPENPYVTPTDVGHLVQRTWSNSAAAASHDPCVPDPTGAFFDAAPVLTEDVTINSTLTGTVTSKGVTIPVGQKKTIEVDLFSDGDTGGPWTVSAADALSTYYAGYGLTPSMTFEWDRTSGQNGEKLHLTITVTASSVIGGAHAFMITSTKGGRSAVWPGLVVE